MTSLSTSSLRSVVPCLSLTLLMAFCLPSAQAQNTGGTYDWQVFDANNKVTSQSPAFSGGQWYGNYFTPSGPYPYGPDIGNTPNNTGSRLGSDDNGNTKSTGTVTATLTWLASGNPNEPAPPCLLVQTGDAEWYASDYSSQPDGGCSDGLGDPEQDAVNASSYSGVSIGTHYSIGVPAGSTISVSLKGAAAHITVPPNSGTISSWVQWTLNDHTITLAAPNPQGRPDQGDGTNQSVYDATAPNGLLNFPGSILVAGAGAAGTAWIMRDPNDINGPHVGLTLDLPAESIAQNWNLYDHTILASVPADTIAVKYGSLPNPGDGFLYAGLPKSNSGFGNHLVTLTVDGKPTTQQAHIQTFFSAKASNYPSAATDYTASSTDPNQRFYTPNWFYYYNQVSASSGNYEPGDQTQTDATTPYAVHIEDQTYGTIPEIHVYSYTKGDMLIKFAGDIQLSGVWLYADVCAHEKEHQTAFTDGTYAIDKTQTSLPWTLTSDNDHLDDTWESNHYFDPTSANTTGAPAYSNESDAPDDETVADILGLGGLLTNFSLWQSDWAGPGKDVSGTAYSGGVQYGAFGFAVAPGGTRPTPYFLFTPATQNPDKTWKYGTPIKIWSAADLQKAAPNYITSIPVKSNP